jgi:anaphase-promoting complex subunit 11
MREVKIKRWHGVAKWKWEVADEEVCGICRMPYEACCPGVKYPGDDCRLVGKCCSLLNSRVTCVTSFSCCFFFLVWGQCGHAFHMQCVLKWLESQQNARQVCPMCRQAWSFRE